MKQEKHKDYNIQMASFLGLVHCDDNYGRFCVPENHDIIAVLGDGYAEQAMEGEAEQDGERAVILDVSHLNFTQNDDLLHVVVDHCIGDPEFEVYPNKFQLEAEVHLGFYKLVIGFIEWKERNVYEYGFSIPSCELCIDDVIRASFDVLTDPLPTNWLLMGTAEKIDFLEDHPCEEHEFLTAGDLWKKILAHAYTNFHFDIATGESSEYFIFGQDASNVYHSGDDGFNDLMKLIKLDDITIDFQAIEFKQGVRASTVIEISCGWMGEAQITQDEFEHIKSVLDEHGNDSHYKIKS